LGKKLPVFLTAPEVNRLIQTPDASKPEGIRDRALLEILYASGLRVSEIWQLNLKNIDAGSHEIRVTGKGNKERIVLIGLPALEALDRYLKTARPILLNNRSNEALWLNKAGKRLSMRGMQKQLKHYALANGLQKNVHPHVLRHTFATHMLDGGADLRVVQELLGHADLSSTQIYTHVTKQQARRVYLTAHPMAQEKDNHDTE
jgi:integrase/recombinase XerC